MENTESKTPYGHSGTDTTPVVTAQQSSTLTRPIILGDLVLASPTTFTTIGSNGAASALTANPVGYLTIMIGNTAYQLPYYNLA